MKEIRFKYETDHETKIIEASLWYNKDPYSGRKGVYVSIVPVEYKTANEFTLRTVVGRSGFKDMLLPINTNERISKSKINKALEIYKEKESKYLELIQEQTNIKIIGRSQ